MKIVFNEEEHRYFIDGIEVPSVTQILKIIQKPYGTEYDMQRGRAVHRAIELYEKGILDETTLSPEVEKYLEQYLQFKKDAKIKKFKAVEKKVGSKELMYAGTIDALTEDTIYDWKCSKEMSPLAPLQLVAYDFCISKGNGFLNHVVVLLQPDGYKIRRLNPTLDLLQVWFNIVHVYHWCRKEGIYAD